ncbi:MAG TPA: hypothetical protein PLZ21_07070, partial [Armatimonadota bacterium]|nr:hypothetical protein [Armatimonadota bacterium]
MHRLLLVMMLVLTLSACALFAEERNPHDGYVFWMPAGELVVGDSVSEKEFNYTKTEDGCTFTVRPREMRHGVPIEQLVIIAPNIGDQKPAPDLYIDGKALSDFEPSTLLWEKGLLGKLALVTFIPMELTEGKKQIQIGLKGKCSDKYLFYFTDDADKLGYRIGGVAEPYSVESSAVNDQYRIDISYRTGIYEFWKGNYSKAREIFLSSVNLEGLTPSGQRLFRRLARWADANIRYQEIKTGEGFYDLGLYSMVNGFYDLAEASFKKATELMPTNPDAWYMYADALSYKISDMHLRMERIYPFYQKAADLYPRENSNTWRNHIALFRNFRILEGDPPKEKVLHITDEQIEYITENWTWCTAIMEAASRGILRFENTYRIYDEEFDNRASWDPKPFMGKLFNRGEVETLMKFTDWTASDCCGMDTGPDRSSSVNIGIRTWDTLYHEWNHALDWAMTCPELGIGVPCTHSSDWTGFQPISSMGMGHHSTNRYYMTPGMYRYV